MPPPPTEIGLKGIGGYLLVKKSNTEKISVRTFKCWQILQGTIVLANLNVCHRDAKLWLKPDQFYPEHFLNQQVSWSLKMLHVNAMNYLEKRLFRFDFSSQN